MRHFLDFVRLITILFSPHKWAGSLPWNDKQNVALRWEVFNVTNSTRFDFNDQNSSSASESNNSIAVPNFGNYTHLMTNPRVMQFALRYEF